jgi:xanthine dehydrogenase YagS FAD-binding subunit
MHPFSYSTASDAAEAIATVTRNTQSSFIAGGTNLLDLMKQGVSKPSQVVDINVLPLTQVEARKGGVRIGALARMSDVAQDPVIRQGYSAISEALLASASPQLRNMASIGGNLMQRTRCAYFRDTAFPCNKRSPGSGCPAIVGENRMHAILGTSEQCIATHPSDLAVALVALDAVVRVQGSKGERSIPIADFHLLPGKTPEQETALAHGELIIAIDVPASPLAVRSHYLKVRDRASYEFALVSVSAALNIEGGIIRAARVALGGVGTKPWRALVAEEALQGKPVSKVAFIAAANAAMQNAQPRQHNAFKIELAKRALVRALATVGEMA